MKKINILSLSLSLFAAIGFLGVANAENSLDLSFRDTYLIVDSNQPEQCTQSINDLFKLDLVFTLFVNVVDIKDNTKATTACVLASGKLDTATLDRKAGTNDSIAFIAIGGSQKAGFATIDFLKREYKAIDQFIPGRLYMVDTSALMDEKESLVMKSLSELPKLQREIKNIYERGQTFDCRSIPLHDLRTDCPQQRR